MNTNHPTQTELAKKVGISQAQVSRILAGKSRPSLPVAEAIAAERGVHVLHVIAPERYGPDGQPIPGQPDETQAHG